MTFCIHETPEARQYQDYAAALRDKWHMRRKVSVLRAGHSAYAKAQESYQAATTVAVMLECNLMDAMTAGS